MNDTDLLMMMPQCATCGEYHSTWYRCERPLATGTNNITGKAAPMLVRDLASEIDKLRAELDKLKALFEEQQVGK